ncbi:PEGA domain-containing protein, partial [bacterium]|nr:PEGA domain-containing protein [bacterium]
MISIRRKILFYLFIIAFFCLSFYVITYVQGYKLNFSFPPNFKMIQRTGMILLKSDPDGATVYINEKPIKSLIKGYLSSDYDYYKTPTKIKNLNPGEYQVRLEKDGYHAWEQKINVYPGLITTISNIHLFKDNLPFKISNNNFLKKNISPNKKYVVNLGLGIIFNLEEEKTATFTPEKNIKTENLGVFWSPDSKKILVDNQIIYPENKSKNQDINGYLPDNIKDLSWGDDNETIYYQQDKSFNSFNIKDLKTKELIKENYLNFLIKSGYLFAINGNGNNKLETRSLDSIKNSKNMEMPCSSGYEIIDYDNNLLQIQDKRYNNLYLIHFKSPVFMIKETINNIKYFKWINEKEIAYANDFEIWSIDLEKNQKTLHSRISEKIIGIDVHRGSGNIIYYTDNDIKIINEEENTKISITKLTELNKVSEVFVGGQDENIFFNGQIGQQEG